MRTDDIKKSNNFFKKFLPTSKSETAVDLKNPKAVQSINTLQEFANALKQLAPDATPDVEKGLQEAITQITRLAKKPTSKNLAKIDFVVEKVKNAFAAQIAQRKEPEKQAIRQEEATKEIEKSIQENIEQLSNDIKRETRLLEKTKEYQRRGELPLNFQLTAEKSAGHIIYPNVDRPRCSQALSGEEQVQFENQEIAFRFQSVAGGMKLLDQSKGSTYDFNKESKTLKSIFPMLELLETRVGTTSSVSLTKPFISEKAQYNVPKNEKSYAITTTAYYPDGFALEYDYYFKPWLQIISDKLGLIKDQSALQSINTHLENIIFQAQQRKQSLIADGEISTFVKVTKTEQVVQEDDRDVPEFEQDEEQKDAGPKFVFPREYNYASMTLAQRKAALEEIKQAMRVHEKTYTAHKEKKTELQQTKQIAKEDKIRKEAGNLTVSELLAENETRINNEKAAQKAEEKRNRDRQELMSTGNQVGLTRRDVAIIPAFGINLHPDHSKRTGHKTDKLYGYANLKPTVTLEKGPDLSAQYDHFIQACEDLKESCTAKLVKKSKSELVASRSGGNFFSSLASQSSVNSIGTTTNTSNTSSAQELLETGDDDNTLSFGSSMLQPLSHEQSAPTILTSYGVSVDHSNRNRLFRKKSQPLATHREEQEHSQEEKSLSRPQLDQNR